MTAPRTCIYCRADEASAQFGTREHVLPQSFGTFEPENLVLDCVCDECNGELGRSIDQVLARGSFEGLYRYMNGIRPPVRATDISYRHISVTIVDPEAWKGMRAALRPDSSDNSRLVVSPISQAAFGDPTSKNVVALDLRELRAIDKGQQALPSHDHVRVCFDSERDEAEIQAILVRNGVRLNTTVRLPWTLAADRKVGVKFYAETTNEIQRAISKVAFNYLAFVVGAEFVAAEEFNPIRKFIRYGTVVDWEHFGTGKPKIMEVGGREDDHVITVQFERSSFGRIDVLANVSLFGLIHYRILLARRYLGLAPRPGLPAGHSFDWRRRRASPLYVFEHVIPAKPRFPS